MIVDDEPKLRQGLQTLIPWEDLGLTVTATAANGKDALDMIRKEPPDIALVDIRMPLMDGLELIQQLRSNDIKMHFIILSGYADFDYAKQAIKFGVDGYILKPVNVSEMTSTLEQVSKRIAEEKVRQEKPPIGIASRDWYLQHFLVSHDKIDTPDKLRRIATDADLLWKSYEIISILLRKTENGRLDILYPQVDKLKTVIEGKGMGVVTVSSPYIVLLLHKPLRGKLQRMNVYQLIRDVLGKEQFIAATGGPVSVPEEIHCSYLNSQKWIKQAFFCEKDQLLGPYTPIMPLPETPLQQACDNDDEMMEEFILRLYYSLDVGYQKMIPSLLQEAAAFFVHQQQNENHVKDSFFFLTNAIIHKLTQGIPHDWKGTEEVSRFLKGIFEYEHLSDLLEETHRFLLALAEEAEPEGKEKELKIMINIIHRHYADNLKLETLAGMLNYSTAYLGQLFKNKTGESFNTYLGKVRIQKAKKLLEQGMKVYEVAERVGYPNVNYFHSKFKKYEGRSPSDFKNP